MDTKNKINFRKVVALYGVMLCSAPTCSDIMRNKELVKRLEKRLEKRLGKRVRALKGKKTENKESRQAEDNWDAVLERNRKTYKEWCAVREQRDKKYADMAAGYIAEAREKGIKESDIPQLVELLETQTNEYQKLFPEEWDGHFGRILEKNSPDATYDAPTLFFEPTLRLYQRLFERTIELWIDRKVAEQQEGGYRCLLCKEVNAPLGPLVHIGYCKCRNLYHESCLERNGYRVDDMRCFTCRVEACYA